jgi:MoxR-like ATPase
MKFEKPHFDPAKKPGASKVGSDGRVAFRASDDKADTYVYTPRTILALNIALATNRPLIIFGEPGSGKSTLAWNASRVLGWRYYKRMITSRTQASDLLYTFDALRRLNDANAERLQADQHYVEPGTLWWAFDPATAVHRGKRVRLEEKDRAEDPRQGEATEQAVVLLDEIDKADPDVPNDLLEAFDLKAFTVSETNDRIQAEAKRKILLILTTNNERELPPAFMRRCVRLTLGIPAEAKEQEDWFVQIARQREGDLNPLYRNVAREVVKLRAQARKSNLRPPGTGEFLDTLVACRGLDVKPTSKAWEDLMRSVLWKHEHRPAPEESEDAVENAE